MTPAQQLEGLRERVDRWKAAMQRQQVSLGAAQRRALYDARTAAQSVVEWVSMHPMVLLTLLDNDRLATALRCAVAEMEYGQEVLILDDPARTADDAVLYQNHWSDEHRRTEATRAIAQLLQEVGRG